MEFAGQFQVSAKYSTLHIARRKHAEVIKAKFADGDNFWLLRQLTQLRGYYFVVGGRIVRMNANARENGAGMCFRQCQGSLTRREVAARINDARNTLCHRSLNHRFTIIVEARSINMRM